MNRKMDTYYMLRDFGLGDYLVPCKEFFDSKGLNKWAEEILEKYGSIGIRTDWASVPPQLLGSNFRMYPCYPHLTMDEFKVKSKELLATGIYSLLVFYSPGQWVSQGVVGLFDNRLVVELDGHEDKSSICRFYASEPLLASYDGPWSYQGPHKRTVQKIMDVLLSRDICNCYVEFTEFEDLGLILWQLRDWNDRLPERIGRALWTNGYKHSIF